MFEDNKTPRRWSLEEIDELLQDSGMLPREDNSQEAVEEAAPTPKAPTFNPRPTRNDNIDHKIITEAVEKSDSVAEPQVYGSIVSEKYREKFYNRPVQNIEKTSEHQLVPEEEQKYERGGFVKKKSNFTPTAEFTPVPNLVPDDKVDERTKVIDEGKTKTIALRSLAVTDGDAHDVEMPVEEEDAQLSLEGFHTEDPVEIVDESQVEEELARKRKAKVNSFAITSEINDSSAVETEKKYGTDEYRTVDDKFKVKYYLKKKKTAARLGMLASFASCAVLVLLSAIAASTDSAVALILLSIIFTILPAAICFEAVFDGLRAFKGLNFNRNSGAVVAVIVSLIQCAVLLFTESPFESGACLFNACAVLSLALNITGEYLEIKRITENFSFISSKKDIYSIGHIEKEETAFEIGRGLLLDDPAVLLSQKTLFPRRFIELSRKHYPSDEFSKKLVPIGFVASFVVALLTLLITKDIRVAITSFSAAVCISVPYFSFFAGSLAISKVSGKLLSNGGMLAGWQAHKMCEESNAVAVDSCNVFDDEGGNVYGIHPFYDIQIDEAIIYTATLAIASGGPLGNLFKRVIVGETSLLPPVDTLAYEDKLGLSAWIFNRRVLVGNEDLLRNHNVEIPDTALILKHVRKGRYPLYLAIDGKAAAVFIVSYDADPENTRLLRKIENNSITLLIRSDDANITDEMVAENLGVHRSGVKVLSAVSGDVYKSYVRETTTAADSLLMHDGKPYSFLYAIKSAISLGDFRHLLRTLQICSMGIGIALVAIISFVSGFDSVNALSLLIIQGFFTAVGSFLISGSHAIKNRKGKKKR